MSERAVPTQLTAVDGVPLAPSVHPPGDHRAPLLGIETHPAGRGTLVVVSGAIDIVTEQALQHGLRQALDRSDLGIDLDLSRVDFCDCSGLNVLLRLRRRALDENKTIVIRRAGASVLRLLSITSTLSLFALACAGEREDEAGDTDETGQARGVSPRAAHAPQAAGVSPGEADQELRIELGQLRRAMQTRPVIDLARGVLMASFGLSAEDAWKVLVSVSQNTNTKLHQVADHLVSAVTGDPLPELFRLQVAETVAKLRTAQPESAG